MTLAIVHDYLGQRGGAERVVLHLAAMFPDAPVYTSFYAPDHTYAEFRSLDVRTSRLQKSVDPSGFRSAVLRYPAAFRAFDLSAFDSVVVSSSTFAHHIVHPRSFVYCHTPPRFLYHPGAYVQHEALARLTGVPLAVLRRSDRRAASRHRSYLANSKATARRILEAYRRAAAVVHPPLWVGHLPAEPLSPPAQPRALAVSRLLPYKRLDVAVRACQQAGIPLTVVGEGPEEATLRALGGPSLRLVGAVPDADLAALFTSHSVVIVPGREDFGYLPIEANYAGRPVVAHAGGGALETVVPGVTGVLVAGHDPNDWANALRAVHEQEWSPTRLRESTKPFQAPHFRAAVRRWLELAEESGQPPA